jgi:hypothetical protein
MPYLVLAMSILFYLSFLPLANDWKFQTLSDYEIQIVNLSRNDFFPVDIYA